MSDENKSDSGLNRTLRKLFGKSEAPTSDGGAEVIDFGGDSKNEEEAKLFHVDSDWREVEGAWVGASNAYGVDPEDVRSRTMGSISQLRSSVRTDGDRKFLALLYERLGERSLGLPDFPETPMRLDQLMKEEEPNSLQVMRCIEADPKLVGRVWRRARSARFPSSPSSLDMAVSRIGLVEVWRLSLEAALDSLEFRAGPYKELAEVVRVHGALVAEVTSGMMGMRRGPSFMAGLLHHVGSLVLLQVASQTLPEFDTVKRVIAAHSTNFSVLVADAWHLEAEIIPAIAYHNDPNAIHAGPRDLGRIVCIANIAVHGELDRRAQKNSFFIEAIAQFTRSRVLASKALNQAAAAIDRMEADGN